jgi:hypothetical protein
MKTPSILSIAPATGWPRRAAMLACLLCLAIPRVPSAEAGDKPLERLFFSPRERAQMEFERDSGRQQEARRQAHKEPPPIPKQIHINGLLLRGNGQNIVWINDSPQPPPGLQPDLQAIQGAEIPIQLYNQPAQWLKPGQRLSTENGAVMEGFNAVR